MNNIFHEDFEKEIVVFGGGCFWCTEAVFKLLKGVVSVEPGYAGGQKENPTYEEVVSHTSDHAEVVKIAFNPEKISFTELLTVFFATHNPTTLNRQGGDVGPQYRSMILYTTEAQKNAAKDFIEKLNGSSPKGKIVVTEVRHLGAFFPAEKEHVDYYKNHPEARYCQVAINPKLEKVQRKFAKLLKTL